MSIETVEQPATRRPLEPLVSPFYERDGITIYHADCREVLPLLGRFDLLLTDPPYGMNLNTDNSRFSGGTKGNMAKRGNGVGSADGKPIHGDDEDFDPSFLLDVASDKVIWGWNHFPDKLPRGACLVWLKRYDEAFGSFLSDAETAWKSKGVGVYCRRDLSNNAIANERVHPTQKPVGLMSWCLTMFPEAKSVLDPFMGSGTTLVAAKRLGLRAVGIEINREYCEAAVERLRQGVFGFDSEG